MQIGARCQADADRDEARRRASYGLADVIVHAGGKTSSAVFSHRVGRQRDNGDMPSSAALGFTQRRDGVIAVQHRH
jgi:hypothetical protein